MIRGGDFYAVWIEEKQIWSTDEDDVLALIDIETRKQVDEYNKAMGENAAYGLYLYNSNNNLIDRWHKYCQKQIRDTYKTLDQKLIFLKNQKNIKFNIDYMKL